MGNLLEAAFTWIFNTMKTGIVSICMFILDMFFNGGKLFSFSTIGSDTGAQTLAEIAKFAPTIAYFRNDVVGTGFYDAVADIMTYISLGLIVIFVFYSLVQLALASVVEMKSSVTTILARGVIATMLVFIAPGLAEWALDVGYRMLMYIFDNLLEFFAGDSSSVLAVFTNMNGVVDAATQELTVGNALGLNAAPGLLNLVISSVLLIVIAYYFIKAAFEIIQHYVLMGALVMLSPFSMAFLVSEDSQIVFRNYWKMLFTEIGLLVFNYLWIVVDLIVIIRMKNVVGCMIAFAVIRIGTQGNQLARSLGFCTSGMIGTLADSFGIAARQTMAAMGTAGRGMKAVGSSSNKLGLVKAGMMMNGQNVLSSNVAREARGNSLGGIFRSQKAANGGLDYNSSVKKSMEGCLAEGTKMGRAQAAELLNELSPEGRAQALKDLGRSPQFSGLAAQMAENGNALQLTGIDERGVSYASLDKNGNLTGTGRISNYNEGGKGSPFKAPNGETKYAIPDEQSYNKPALGSVISPQEGAKFNGHSNLENATGLNSRQLWAGLTEPNGELRPGVNPSDYQFVKRENGWERIKKGNGEGVALWKGSAASGMGGVTSVSSMGRGQTLPMSDFLKSGGSLKDVGPNQVGMFRPAGGNPAFGQSGQLGRIEGYRGQSFDGARFVGGSSGGSIAFADGTRGRVDKATADSIMASGINTGNLAGLSVDGNGMLVAPLPVDCASRVAGIAETYSGNGAQITGITAGSGGTASIDYQNSDGTMGSIGGLDAAELASAGITDEKASAGSLSIDGSGRILDSSAEGQLTGSLDDAVLRTDNSGTYIEMPDGTNYMCSDDFASQMEDLGYSDGDCLYGFSAATLYDSAGNATTGIYTPPVDEDGDYMVGTIETDGSINASTISSEPENYGIMSENGTASLMEAQDVEGSAERWSSDCFIPNRGEPVWSGSSWSALDGTEGATIPYNSVDITGAEVSSIDDMTLLRLQFAGQGDFVESYDLNGNTKTVKARVDGAMKGAISTDDITEAYRLDDDMFAVRYKSDGGEKIAYVGRGTNAREKLKADYGKCSTYEGNADWGSWTVATKEIRKGDTVPGRQEEDEYRNRAAVRTHKYYNDSDARKEVRQKTYGSKRTVKGVRILRAKQQGEDQDTMPNP